MTSFERPSQVPKNTNERPETGLESVSETKEDFKEVVEEVSTSEKGLINSIRQFINSKVEESKFPTKEGLGYESSMGIYGGKLVKDGEGRLVYDTRGFWSKIDQWGDRVLRAFDEHHARNPGKMFMRRPIEFLKLLPFIVDSKRYRGTPAQTVENISRLGLDEYYGIHPWGIEVKKPEVFSSSIGLQDIFRQDQINHPALENIDRFEAVGKAAVYMRTLHERAGGIAEGNACNFIFTETDGTNVDNPILMIPTEIYNPEKNISDIEQHATDLLDLLASVSVEEYRRSKDWNNVRKALQTALERYNDGDVTKMVASYVRRGRLTLLGDTEGLEFDNSTMYKASRHVFAAHNTQRLSVKNPEVSVQVRNEIINSCESFVTLSTQ